MGGRDQSFGRDVLCVVPPYGTRVPAGMAYLLGYLEAHGCYDFSFVDLRLGAPFDFTPTYRTTGAFGESFVIDVPDLPLVLDLLRSFAAGGPLVPARTSVFERYCFERGISPQYLGAYLECMGRYLVQAFDQLPGLRTIGFSVWSTNYLFTLMAAALLKRRPDAPRVILGGPQVTSSHPAADLALRSGLADVVVLGDGEETLLELHREIVATGQPPKGLAGTATLDPSSGTVVRVERARPRMVNVPTPSFERMPIHSYQERSDIISLPLQFSRGCTDKCSFCSEWVFWQRFRPDAPEHTVEHIVELQRRYGCNFIDFSDSLLNGIPRRLVALADRILERGIDVGWTAFMRAEMDLATAKHIKRAGCYGVFIGIESFSDEALALMNKRRTEADNIRAIRSFLDAGIYVTAGFIPGFPGDSRAGFLHSVSVVRELQNRYPGMLELHEEPFTVMANAPIHRALEGSGLAPRRWDDCYLDIAPEYRDVTGAIVCEVTGDGQGLERLGRMTIIGAAKSDAPTKGSFEDGHDDDLPFQYFCFDHLMGSWYCARIKTQQGYRYAVLVNESEQSTLQQLQEEHFPLADLTRGTLARELSAVERRHVLTLSRKGQPLVSSHYSLPLPSRARYTTSPFVVAREIVQGRRVLTLDTLMLRTGTWSGLEAQVLRVMRRRAMSAKAITTALRRERPQLTTDEVEGALEALAHAGVVAVAGPPARRAERPSVPIIAEREEAAVVDQTTLVPLASLRRSPQVA